MVTDPPYGVEYDPAWRNDVVRANGTIVSARATGKVLNDDIVGTGGRCGRCSPATSPTSGTPAFYVEEVEESLAAASFRTEAQIVWAKNRAS